MKEDLEKKILFEMDHDDNYFFGVLMDFLETKRLIHSFENHLDDWNKELDLRWDGEEYSERRL
jgi:hypothetical protein